MPLEVPDEPKVYTTKYQNWRGVDYTNDASNVWYRRSPNGVNMLPDLDGQPFKRSGWKIEFTSEDFCDAAGIANTEVEQYKVDYFELEGAEYLWFFTSIGVFYHKDADELVYVNTSYEGDDGTPWGSDDKPYHYGKTQSYKVGDYCWYKYNGTNTDFRCTTAIGTGGEAFTIGHWQVVSDGDFSKTFPPSGATIDYSKAFFFEGGGRAAYYFFVDNIDNESKLYWFDGEKLHESHPHIPTVLDMCAPNGTGIVDEDTNMLTEWRAIQYELDGTSTQFTIPDGYVGYDDSSMTGIFNVYTKTASGEWTPNGVQWAKGNNAGTVKVTSDGTNPLPVVIPNQPNLRIVYKTANATISTNHKTPYSKKLKVRKTIVEKMRQVKNNGQWDYPSIISGTKTITYSNVSTPTFELSNPKKPLASNVTRHVWSNGAWGANASRIEMVFNSYGSKVTLKSKGYGKEAYEYYTSIEPLKTQTVSYEYISSTERRKVTTTTYTRTLEVKIEYDQWLYSTTKTGANRAAFNTASKSLIFGNGIINQVFLTAATKKNYNSRVWYSYPTNPLYFPDLNYIEVGAIDKAIVGLIKVGDYLGVVKQGSATDTTIYLAYPTSFDEITTYAVKQSVNGIGAISNGAFNILNDEPLFLSEEGVMGIEPAEDDARKLRNRSYYINKKLMSEPSLENAFSFVFDGMYWLGVNNHCYVLDGSQKTSWENTKTNLQYECYYLDNIPAKCFAKKDGYLWFIDNIGNVCRFRDDSDDRRYVDDYDALGIEGQSETVHKASAAPTLVDGELVLAFADTRDRKEVVVTEETEDGHDATATELMDWYANGVSVNLGDCDEIVDVTIRYALDIEYGDDIIRIYTLDVLSPVDYSSTVVDDERILTIPSGRASFSTFAGNAACVLARVECQCYAYSDPVLDVNAVIQYGDSFYTVIKVNEDDETVVVDNGVPVTARWGTIADDDGSAHYYKKLQKKGSVVALMPMSDSGVRVWVIPDEKDPIFVGETEAGSHILPFNYYMRKKVKKYKRLQIVCENDGYNVGFGVDEIIKSYTLGNYAKK